MTKTRVSYAAGSRWRILAQRNCNALPILQAASQRHFQRQTNFTTIHLWIDLISHQSPIKQFSSQVLPVLHGFSSLKSIVSPVKLSNLDLKPQRLSMIKCFKPGITLSRLLMTKAIFTIFGLIGRLRG
ncbi:hypothetical protein H6F73_22070 [Microcoleus sp. FACHB-68]|nr:hypothetical protein [Microcoleus sp. FACHB-68]